MMVAQSYIEQKNMKTQNEEVIPLNEAAEFLRVSKSCLYKKTSQKQIPYYKPPGCKRIYFRKKELEEWLLCNRVKTTMELEQDSKGYLSKKAKFLKSC
jgi:excisionase family DNA binding protein